MSQINYDIERLFDPIDDVDVETDQPERVRCKHCGKDNLYWSDHVDGWRLETESGTPHDCTRVNFKQATEGFERTE